jgi:hypothetical protein
LIQQIFDETNRKRVTTDGNQAASNPQSDRGESFDKFYILVMLTEKISQEIIVGENDLVNTWGFEYLLQIVSPSF